MTQLNLYIKFAYKDDYDIVLTEIAYKSDNLPEGGQELVSEAVKILNMNEYSDIYSETFKRANSLRSGIQWGSCNPPAEQICGIDND